MASSFKNYTANTVTTVTTVVTGPVATQTTVIGMTVSNVGATVANVIVKLNTTSMVYNAPIPVGGTLVVVGGDQKVVLEAGDTINVTSTIGVDIIVSTLEVA